MHDSHEEVNIWRNMIIQIKALKRGDWGRREGTLKQLLLKT